MEKQEETRFLKRTPKDCAMSFKLQIIQEVERGITTVTQVKKQYGIQSRFTIVHWLRKFGNFY
jgi:transposase-like protein